MKIAVLSDGGWGTALALLLCRNGHEVCLWGPFPEYIEEMRQSRLNPKFLAGIELDPGLSLSADMAEATTDAEIIVMASPTQYARGTLKTLAEAGRPAQSCILVNVAKGIELESLKRLSEIAGDELGSFPYVALSGPSHAEEVARNIPTAVVVAATDSALAAKVQAAFFSETFRVYTSNDVIGVETGGALKNVFAIAAGICDGMKLGDNPKAALLTRGIAEMARLGQALGGRAETFAGLSGIGDMIVTCTSGHSRNRHVGEELGRGKKLETIIQDMGMVVAEGVKTTRSAYELARNLQVETPIIDEVYAGLYLNKDPRVGVRDLMTRAPKAEIDPTDETAR